MKKKYTFKPSILISNLITLAFILFLVWVGLSWIEVITHNGPFTTGYEYNALNFFKILAQ